MRARNWVASAKSQAARIERLAIFRGRFADKSFQVWASLWVIQEFLPGFVIAAGEEEAGKSRRLPRVEKS